jgi:hypothetical protein
MNVIDSNILRSGMRTESGYTLFLITLQEAKVVQIFTSLCRRVGQVNFCACTTY